MINYRTYGAGPYKVAVVHGGPGAPGSVAAIARELSKELAVLEPLQTETTLEGQVQELYETLCSYGAVPITVIGHSWGAWLSFILAAKHPDIIKKLILVSSGPFESRYVRLLEEARFSRMSPEEKAEAKYIIEYLGTEAGDKKLELLARLGELVEKTDNYELEIVATDRFDLIQAEGDTYQQVWSEADKLRHSGQLLEFASKIKCPVVAIHGDYDPHPAEGVREPLEREIKDFHFYLLNCCDHSPWKERHAREEFYKILKSELQDSR